MIRALCLFVCHCLAIPVIGETFAHEVPVQAEAAKAPKSVRRAFTLVRHDGQTVTDKTFYGKNLLIFFGFTSCTDVCPTGLVVISQAAKQLERAGIDVTPVFITVDPDRDTSQLLANYVKHFHPRMVGLTGSRQNISNAAAAYGVQFGVQKNASAYYVWHSSNTYLVGTGGKLLETFPPYAAADTIVAGTRSALTAPKKAVLSTPGVNGTRR